MLDYTAYQKAARVADKAKKTWDAAHRRRMVSRGSSPHDSVSTRTARQDLIEWRFRIAEENAAALAYIDARIAMHSAEYGEA